MEYRLATPQPKINLFRRLKVLSRKSVVEHGTKRIHLGLEFPSVPVPSGVGVHCSLLLLISRSLLPFCYFCLTVVFN